MGVGAGAGAGAAGAVLPKFDCVSEEAALRLAFRAVILVEGNFFSGALYTKGADIGIVGVMRDVVAQVELG